MKNVLIAVLLVATLFLGSATYMQAKGQLVYNPNGVYQTGYTQADRDQLTAMLASYEAMEK